MALKIKKAQLNIEFTGKYETYANYINHLVQENPDATIEGIKEYFLENFNIMNKEALENSMESDVNKSEKADALLNLESDLKENLLKFILGEDTTDTKLTQKKLTGGISIFKDMVEANATKLKKVSFYDEVISKNKTGYLLRESMYFEEEGFFIKVNSRNGKIEKIIKEKFKKNSKEVRKITLKTYEDGESIYIENKANNKYIKLNTDNKIVQIDEVMLESNRKNNHYYETKKTQDNVTLYDKIKKDIDIVLETIKNEKGFAMKDYLGILKIIDFVTKDILLDKSYGFINSISGSATFMPDDGKLSLLDTYSNMIYGQGFEMWNAYRIQLENKEANVKTLEIVEWNKYVQATNETAKSKQIPVKNVSTLASVDIIMEEETEESKQINFYEVKHFRPNYFGDFKVYQKNPRKIIGKMEKLVDYTELVTEVNNSEGEKPTTSKSVYDISTYDKDGGVSTAEIDMRDYITFFKEIGEKIQEVYISNGIDENGEKITKSRNNTLFIEVRGIKIKIMIESDRTKNKINLETQNIMDKNSKGVANAQFVYENNEEYIKLLGKFGAKISLASEKSEKQNQADVKKVQMSEVPRNAKPPVII